ncbi:hypothetical protein [Marinobacter shengliensis]|uniref:hypothetical protein n=1 Tax=Marinobacter shengliensis TaxID=1389223 RepID=UPI001E5C08EA|nr:hypothetical protein [Marinobacter shengliensis]MCD1631364.1 hypothetical protein [Marinobacter shengliensis]
MAISCGRLPIGSLPDATWTTIDLKTIEPGIAGASFALIEVNGTSNFTSGNGARPPGSSDPAASFSNINADDCNFVVPIRLGTNEEIEFYVQYNARAGFYLRGYGSEINWITPTELSTTSPVGQWHVYDLSAVLPPEAEFVVVRKGEGTGLFRAVGETQPFETLLSGADVYQCDIIKLNAAKEIEVYIKNSFNAPEVLGWIGVDEFLYRMDPAPRSLAAADTWQDFPDSDPAVVFAYMSAAPVISDANDAGEHAYREKGSTDGVKWNRAVSSARSYVLTNNGQVEFISRAAQGNFWYRGGFVADGGIPPSPTVEITGDLQPGASFTLNYSNYDAIPVSPVTITDSNNNSITVAVTINDTEDGGKHSGTATGTYPALPSSGTATGLLFGNVTVELNT